MLKENQIIELIDEKGKKYLIKLEKGKEFAFHKGKVLHNEILTKKEGDFVFSSKKEKLLIFSPPLRDFVLKMKRGAQIIYPKDMGPILIYGDIFPGAKVLEAGIGSGALTIALLRAVGKNGVVISYEKREDFIKIAQKNIENFFKKVKNAGERGKLIIKKGDVYEKIEEKDFDRVIFDLAEPWRAIDNAQKALKPGGILICYNPTVIQIEKVAREIKRKNFYLEGIYEFLMRGWDINEKSFRPQHRMVAHTGFIVVARKLC